ncbi:slr1659 superfamily regulator [Aminobacter sp. LjRoot7]|uniref:slr1659 superfamily regulator n=1 Tax=Aminobacter sp. LjRoot7 TaxID=3342335 RepID=UPI003ECD0B2C
MDIKTDDYSVWAEGTDLYFSGVMRPENEAASAITSLVRDLLDSGPPVLTVHLSDLEFLNSQGRNILVKLMIEARNHPQVRMVVRGSSNIVWQDRSLPILKRIYPGLVLLMD